MAVLRAVTPRGFTLVEVVVSMLIVGVLSAIAIAGFAQYQGRARDAAVHANATALAAAVNATAARDQVVPALSVQAALSSGQSLHDYFGLAGGDVTLTPGPSAATPPAWVQVADPHGRHACVAVSLYVTSVTDGPC